MNCKHLENKGNIADQYCKVKKIYINPNLACKDCLLKISDFPSGFNKVFGDIK